MKTIYTDDHGPVYSADDVDILEKDLLNKIYELENELDVLKRKYVDRGIQIRRLESELINDGKSASHIHSGGKGGWSV